MKAHLPSSTLFPYTTLFRSNLRRPGRGLGQRGRRRFGGDQRPLAAAAGVASGDRKSTRLNSSHVSISYAVFCLKKKSRPQTFASPPVVASLLSSLHSMLLPS